MGDSGERRQINVTTDDYEDSLSTVEPTPLPPLVEPRRRRNRGRLRCILGVMVFGGLLVATRFSHLWSSFDVLSHFTLHFAILTIAFAIGYFMPIGRVLTAIIVALIGFAVIGAYPQYVSEHPRVFSVAQAGEKPVRIMAFNSGFKNENTDAIVAEVRRLDPDVAILIELNGGKSVVLKLLKDKYPHLVECIAEPYCHLAIISKIPISSGEAKGLWKGPPLIRATLAGNYSDITVIGVHTIRTPHIRAQFGQMRELVDFLNGFPGSTIVAGDFNATPFARLFKMFSERTGLRRITNLPSWPGYVELPQLAIDHIFLSSKIRVLEEARIGKRAGSDHYPVSALLAVPSSPSAVPIGVGLYKTAPVQRR
jgi:endonuclease/exonuclease/phosphatase (EEP) superfamily protein YafD